MFQQKCVKPTIPMYGRIVTYSADDSPTLQQSINEWFVNSKQKPCAMCNNGVRKYGERYFVSDPLVIPIDVSNCPWSAPNTLHMNGKYGLAGVTYGSNDHFVSNIRCIPSNKWVFYDGLREYHSKGSGLKKILADTSPQRHHRSYAIYDKLYWETLEDICHRVICFTSWYLPL